MNGLQSIAAERIAELSGKRFAVGVSGGRDSMCLLHAVLHCGAADVDDILCVHINHGLRETAARDEAFVQKFCAEHGVAFRRYSVDVVATCAKTGDTVEQAARNLRYGIFAELIDSGECAAVFTAHHALDNAESVLMHLFRGAGLDGLRGIAGTSPTGIIRPFIDVMPSALDDYCREHDIRYMLDETNLVDAADRNFIRLDVLPLVTRRYRGAIRAVNALAAECRDACAALDLALDPKLIARDRGAVVIGDKAFENKTLGARYVRHVLGEYFSPIDVTREVIERTVALAGMRTGARVELQNGVVAARESAGVALFVPREKYCGETQIKLGANFIDGLAVDIVASDVSPASVRGGAVDLDTLNGAVLRFRRDGDTITPFGSGSKKLKQYFIDNKIPARVRERIPLICRGNEVLVVVGMQIGESVKQTERTTRRGVIGLRTVDGKT